MLRHPTHVRIATELATGKRYVVLSVRSPRDTPVMSHRVHCFGEVYFAKGLQARHQPGLQFTLDEVTIEEVRFTKALLRSLLRQYLKGLRGRGYDVTLSFTKSGELAYEAVNGTSRLVVR